MFRDKTGKTLTTGQLFAKVINRIKNILLELGVYFLHCVGFVPSHSFRRFFYRLSGVKIGRGSTINTWDRFYEIIYI